MVCVQLGISVIRDIIELESKILDLNYQFVDEWNEIRSTIWRGFYDDYFIIPNILLNLEFTISFKEYNHFMVDIIQIHFEEGLLI